MLVDDTIEKWVLGSPVLLALGKVANDFCSAEGIGQTTISMELPRGRGPLYGSLLDHVMVWRISVSATVVYPCIDRVHVPR